MTYERRHAALIEYLRTCVDAGDWHGASDAANDLRVLEAQNADKPDYIRPVQRDKYTEWLDSVHHLSLQRPPPHYHFDTVKK